MDNNRQSFGRKPVRVLGTPIEKDGTYYIEAAAKQNKLCGWVCPKCQKPVVICPPLAGKMWVTCRACATKTLINVNPDVSVTVVSDSEPVSQEPTPTPPPAPVKEPTTKPETTQVPPVPEASENVIAFEIPSRGPSDGELSWGNIFRRKRHILTEGTTVIGRNDPETHSDLEFDDGRMSRRSVSICVERKAEGGFTYKLTVLKSGNPVLVDNKTIPVGKSVMLEKRNTITMGRTVINFKEKK